MKWWKNGNQNVDAANISCPPNLCFSGQGVGRDVFVTVIYQYIGVCD